MNIFKFDDYKAFTHALLAEMPKAGHGEMAKIAKHLRMHPTRISQVFKGTIELTVEQGHALSKYLGLSALETEYFMNMIHHSRAGTKELKDFYTSQLTQTRERSKKLVHRVPRDKTLTTEEKAVFYSNWSYSGVRLATSIDGLNSVESLATHFELPRERIREIIDFLLQTGLCVEKDGLISLGPKNTHLEQGSPMLLRFHSNWRLKGLHRHESLTPEELAYTCPVSINHKDLLTIRELVSKTIEKFLKTVRDSEPPDTLACLTIDWFKV